MKPRKPLILTTDSDLTTTEGLNAAREWVQSSLSTAADGSICLLPPTRTGYCINRKHKTACVAFGKDDPIIRQLIEDAGWQVPPGRPRSKEACR